MSNKLPESSTFSLVALIISSIIGSLLVNEQFTNVLDNTNDNENENKSNNLNNFITQLNNYTLNQQKLNTTTLIVWVISLVLLLTLGVWLWNNILVELVPVVNKVKNPLQLLGLILLLNMII